MDSGRTIPALPAGLDAPPAPPPGRGKAGRHRASGQEARGKGRSHRLSGNLPGSPIITPVLIGEGRQSLTALRAGPLGIAILAASVVFLAGSLLFCLALFRDETALRIPAAAYALAAVPIGFRSLVPEIVLDLALAILAGAVLWLAFWLLTLPARALPHRVRPPRPQALSRSPRPTDAR